MAAWPLQGSGPTSNVPTSWARTLVFSLIDSHLKKEHLRGDAWGVVVVVVVVGFGEWRNYAVE